MSVVPRLGLLVFASFSFLLLLGSRAGAVTITATELPEGQTSIVLADATVNVIGGSFAPKSHMGLNATGVGGGLTGGEIDTSGEGIEFVFDDPTTLSVIELSYLYAAPNWGDTENEVARLVAVVGGNTIEGLLTVVDATTATWSFAGGGAVTNLSPADESGTALWSIANPFGGEAISSLTLLPVDTNGAQNESNADYSFVRLSDDDLPPVAEPFGLGLAALGALALARRQRRA
jgi:MYXO-CTERM domain-containing protein